MQGIRPTQERKLNAAHLKKRRLGQNMRAKIGRAKNKSRANGKASGEFVLKLANKWHLNSQIFWCKWDNITTMTVASVAKPDL